MDEVEDNNRLAYQCNSESVTDSNELGNSVLGFTKEINGYGNIYFASSVLVNFLNGRKFSDSCSLALIDKDNSWLEGGFYVIDGNKTISLFEPNCSEKVLIDYSNLNNVISRYQAIMETIKDDI